MDYVQRRVCFVNVQSSLPLNVIFFLEYSASTASMLAEEILQNAEGFVESVGSIEEMSQMINNVDCHR